MIEDKVLLDDWHAVARSADVYPGKLLATVLLEEEILIWRTSEAVTAWRDQCPHRGARLSLGRLKAGDRLACAYHGWEYDSSGRCVRMPAAPNATPPAKAAVRTYRTCERYGLVWVCLGTPARDVPELSGLDDDYELVVTGPYDVETSGPRAVENFLDLAHFPFVHRGSLGEEPHTEIPDYDVETTNDGVVVRNIKAWQPRSSSVSEGGAYVAYTYRVDRPLTALLTKEPGAVGEKPAEIIMITVAPLAETRARAWFLLAMTYAKGKSHRQFIDFQDAIFLQDKAVLESQRPKRLPLDATAEIHQRADRTSVAYRRWLKSLGLTYGVIAEPERIRS
jgi:phenylpropionate dioxygenase-like ring-hydroxylating dioxygenase large terminal subunit